MKAILEFNLPEEQVEQNKPWMAASGWRSAMSSISGCGPLRNLTFE